MPFSFKKLYIPDLILIEPKVFNDGRGFFAELYKSTDFKTAGIKKPFVQVNHSKSEKGVLRGLHYQIPPKAQAKLITVVQGEIFDVAVDIRKRSKTFGKWVSVKLDAKSKNMLYVPEGFAHGFCVTSKMAEVIYFCTEIYSPKHERGIIWNDSDLNIKWPVKEPKLSKRDIENVNLCLTHPL